MKPSNETWPVTSVFTQGPQGTRNWKHVCVDLKHHSWDTAILGMASSDRMPPAYLHQGVFYVRVLWTYLDIAWSFLIIAKHIDKYRNLDEAHSSRMYVFSFTLLSITSLSTNRHQLGSRASVALPLWLGPNHPWSNTSVPGTSLGWEM